MLPGTRQKSCESESLGPSDLRSFKVQHPSPWDPRQQLSLAWDVWSVTVRKWKGESDKFPSLCCSYRVLKGHELLSSVLRVAVAKGHSTQNLCSSRVNVSLFAFMGCD